MAAYLRFSRSGEYLQTLLACATFAATLALVSRTAVAAPVSVTELMTEAQAHKGQLVLLRAPTSSSSTVYVETAEGLAYYAYRGAKAFRLRQAEPVLVAGIGGSPSRVDVQLKSKRRGTFALQLYPPPGKQLDLPLVRALLADIIATSGEPEQFPAVIGNRVSRMAHARGANHLPDSLSREPFAALVDAERMGYHACPLCFHHTPLVPDLNMELALGELQAGQVMQSRPVITDGSEVRRVREAGARVLAHWPMPLRGYNYRFDLVDDPSPNAHACAGGRVFVTSGLLLIVEDEAELEAVLAHEITHVERRHGYQQLREAMTGQLVSSIVGAVAGGIATAHGASPAGSDDAYRVASLMSTVAFAIAIAGHSRTNEEEADSYALAYELGRAGQEGLRSVRNVMAKFQYDETLGGPVDQGGSGFATHPHIVERVAKASGASVQLFPPASRWGGYDKEGELVAVLTLGTLATYKYPLAPEVGSLLPPRETTETRIFGTIEALSGLKGTQSLRSMTITTQGHETLLDNFEDTRVSADDAVGFSVFVRDSPTQVGVTMDALRCDMGGIASWGRLDDGE